MKMLLNMITDFSTIKKGRKLTNAQLFWKIMPVRYKSVSILFTDNKSGQLLKMVAWWERLLSTVLKHHIVLGLYVHLQFILCFYSCKSY